MFPNAQLPDGPQMAAVHARQSFLQTPTLHSILQLSDALPELQIEPRFLNIPKPQKKLLVTFQAFSSLKPWIIQSTFCEAHVVSKHVDIAGLFGRVSQLLGNPKLWAKCDEFKQKLSMNHLPISIVARSLDQYHCPVPNHNGTSTAASTTPPSNHSKPKLI